MEKNEKLAYRLAEIITKLNSGERLSLDELANEFNAHVRTIRRDLEERLAFFPLVKDSGLYYLEPSYLGRLSYNDIRNFAQISGFSKLYPNLNLSFLRELLDSRADNVYSSKGYFFEDASKFTQLIAFFSKAIKSSSVIAFYYKNIRREVHPYRILHHHGSWYLAATHLGELKAYKLSRIDKLDLDFSSDRFQPLVDIIRRVNSEESVWFSEHKQEIVLSVDAEVSDHFRQRKLMPEQKIIKELEDGGLLILSRITHEMQILPLVRYWIPHVRIIKPAGLQQNLMTELDEYAAVGKNHVLKA